MPLLNGHLHEKPFTISAHAIYKRAGIAYSALDAKNVTEYDHHKEFNMRLTALQREQFDRDGYLACRLCGGFAVEKWRAGKRAGVLVGADVDGSRVTNR